MITLKREQICSYFLSMKGLATAEHSVWENFKKFHKVTCYTRYEEIDVDHTKPGECQPRGTNHSLYFLAAVHLHYLKPLKLDFRHTLVRLLYIYKRRKEEKHVTPD